MAGSCRCKKHPNPQHEPATPSFSPDLKDWRTFCIHQDKGRATHRRNTTSQLHTTHQFWHFIEHGFVPGLAPGPEPKPNNWTTEKILIHDQAAGYMGDPWLDWVVRPKGTACRESKFKWCTTCEAVVAVPLGCHLKTCPRCWNSWANVEAGRITNKVAYARRAGFTKGRVWHVMIRPPRGTVGFKYSDVVALRSRCYKIAKEHGVRGGAAFIHWGPSRDPSEPWNPHVHIIGYLEGRYKPGPSKEGWTVVFEKIRGRDGLYANVRRVAYYELTHCIRPETKGHAVTWFGFMANNQMPTPNPDMVRAMGLDPGDGPNCPGCAGPLTSIQIWDFTEGYGYIIGSYLDGLDKPPPIVTGPPDEPGGSVRAIRLKTWDDFWDTLNSGNPPTQ